MHEEDIKRDLAKIADTLDAARKYIRLQSEANAALHLNPNVYVSPLGSLLEQTQESVRRLQDNFGV